MTPSAGAYGYAKEPVIDSRCLLAVFRERAGADIATAGNRYAFVGGNPTAPSPR